MYTSVCLNKTCSTSDVERNVGKIIPVVAYDYSEHKQIDGIAIFGCIVIAIWVVILVVWSLYVYLNHEDVVK